MKELGYGEASMRKETMGKQRRSWLGVEVRSEFFVEAEEGEIPPASLADTWKEVADGER